MGLAWDRPAVPTNWLVPITRAGENQDLSRQMTLITVWQTEADFTKIMDRSEV